MGTCVSSMSDDGNAADVIKLDMHVARVSVVDADTPKRAEVEACRWL